MHIRKYYERVTLPNSTNQLALITEMIIRSSPVLPTIQKGILSLVQQALKNKEFQF